MGSSPDHKAMTGPGSPVGVPRHIAIIMDGNGRWAQSRGLPRVEGHRRGVEALRRTVDAAGQLGVQYLTVYSFSIENWRRPASEVSDLMGLIKLFIRRDLAELHRNGVRICVVGAPDDVPHDVGALLHEAQETTRNNKELTLVVAFNYGARQEIVQAARRIAEAVAAGTMRPEDVTEASFAKRLYTADIPEPDLVIRTSGELRLSNFLLWQSAYAEFVFTDVLWPDFARADLEAAIDAFRQRERRYGGLSHAEAPA
jgi:undecaprenyl diphosphate synthase